MTVVCTGSVVAIAGHSRTAGGVILAAMSGRLPKITVIIAVRNGAATLQRALDSVLEQTHGHVELIVIDGASTDGTAKIIERNAAWISYWESKPDRGICHAWNKALDHATGDWIIFLGADDRFHAPDVLTRLAPHLDRAAGHYRIVYGPVRVVRHDGSLDREAGIPWEAARSRFPAGVMIPHQGTFHHRSMFDQHGRFDEGFRIVGDYELLLRELVHHDALFVSGIVVVDMGAGGLSDLPAQMYRILREIHRARSIHGLESEPAWRSGPIVRTLIRIWITRTFGGRAAEAVRSIYRCVWRKGRQSP